MNTNQTTQALKEEKNPGSCTLASLIPAACPTRGEVRAALRVKGRSVQSPGQASVLEGAQIGPVRRCDATLPVSD